ncbi:MAG: riboflavin synthase, partial [Ureaplasma sp.]|nr:riboflavin synthase [Ureaplasma sp.]
NKTTIWDWKVNDNVNLELALRFDDFLGGHLVTGHIDGVAKLIEKEFIKSSILLNFSANLNIINNIVDKGSIAINGISLTIIERTDEWFSVSIIEHTQEVTNISSLEINDYVNIETDYFVKIIKSNMEKIK